jgi:hypothetical protein
MSLPIYPKMTQADVQRAKTTLGPVTDVPQFSAADVIRTSDTRWTLERWLKDVKPWLLDRSVV